MSQQVTRVASLPFGPVRPLRTLCDGPYVVVPGLGYCAALAARVIGVPRRGIRPRVRPSVRAVVCVSAVEFAHRHPGESGVAALNIRHGCRAEPVRIPPTIATGKSVHLNGRPASA